MKDARRLPFRFIVKRILRFDNLSMFRRFNPNPANKSVGDCTVRAMCKLFNLDWVDAYDDLTNEGRLLFDMMQDMYNRTSDGMERETIRKMMDQFR